MFELKIGYWQQWRDCPNSLSLASPYSPPALPLSPSPPSCTYKLVDGWAGRLGWEFGSYLVQVGILLALLYVMELAVNGGLGWGGGRGEGQ